MLSKCNYSYLRDPDPIALGEQKGLEALWCKEGGRQSLQSLHSSPSGTAIVWSWL